MSIVDRPLAAQAAAFPAAAGPIGPVSLAMYDRMIAAGIADYWVVDLASQAVVVLRDPRDGRYETRSTHRGDDAVRPLARPEASLLPRELFATE